MVVSLIHTRLTGRQAPQNVCSCVAPEGLHLELFRRMNFTFYRLHTSQSGNAFSLIILYMQLYIFYLITLFATSSFRPRCHDTTLMLVSSHGEQFRIIIRITSFPLNEGPVHSNGKLIQDLYTQTLDYRPEASIQVFRGRRCYMLASLISTLLGLMTRLGLFALFSPLDHV